MPAKSLKNLFKRLLYSPKGIVMGQGSFVRRPYTVANGERITIGNNTNVLPDARLICITEYGLDRFDPRMKIGNDVYIGYDAYIVAHTRVNIGDGCVLSDHVYINDGTHGLDPDAGPIMNQRLSTKGPIIIGAHTFIGYRAAVMPGVELGEHCVVGINAVVTKSFPAYSMIGGSPARLLRRYDLDTHSWVSV